jgi:uncharacterized coiled-coil protein SlyX
MDADKIEKQLDELSSKLTNIQDKMDVDKIVERLDELSSKLTKTKDAIESQASSTRWTFGCVTSLVIIVILLVLGMISNPPKSLHINMIASKKPLVAESEIHFESFYVFSVAEIKDKSAGTFGIFGQVFYIEPKDPPLKE